MQKTTWIYQDEAVLVSKINHKKTYAKIFIYSSCHSMKSMCTCFFSLSCQFLSQAKENVCWFLLLFFHALHLTSRVKNRPQFPVCHLCVTVVCKLCRANIATSCIHRGYYNGVVLLHFLMGSTVTTKNAKQNEEEKNSFVQLLALKLPVVVC